MNVSYAKKFLLFLENSENETDTSDKILSDYLDSGYGKKRL